MCTQAKRFAFQATLAAYWYSLSLLVNSEFSLEAAQKRLVCALRIGSADLAFA